MVYRIYVEKKPELAHEAGALLSELRDFLGIRSLERVRILNRYDAEHITAELFQTAVTAVFSEPPLDVVTETPDFTGSCVFAVESLPGQFDQRADSAAQCIQLIGVGEKPTVRTAKVYALYGDLTDAELEKVKQYVINPVEARETGPEKPETLEPVLSEPQPVPVLEGFTRLNEEQLAQMVSDYGLAMDLADLIFCREHFASEHRDPTLTELRVIDTYWSDHCRHTTFNTVIDRVSFEDPVLEKAYRHYLSVREELGRTKPVTLMDIGTLAAKSLRARGLLNNLDESDEINACTVKITVEADGREEPWLLLFKNETHNHPTEIEPFGGAATCIGGAIRDPLSGRSYVYAAMRLTGAADPLTPPEQTLKGKLPQRKIVTGAAAGYASYGNQIGLATGIVDEVYHPGYAAKRMEIGAVVGAAPAENVRRECPQPGDVVLLLGGATGRDGIGGATGSSKAHTVESVETCGAEVQKGNAPEERKLQRLFRDPEASRLIKRCNDFGAGGVSVAVGELADGLAIDLNAVPKKYEGLDGTELAISESQERMAVVVAAADEAHFLEMAENENIRAVRIAVVTEEPRLKMTWKGQTVVDLSRAFLDTNGAEKHIEIAAPAAPLPKKTASGSFGEQIRKIASDWNTCSRRGLSERFDSTIGAGTVLMPFGGKYQRTPIQAMVHKISMEKCHTDDCSVMSWGFHPEISAQSPYHGAYLAVTESVCKLIATGAAPKDIYLSFQEYFGKPGKDPARWGVPFAALLGAFEAQTGLGFAAIGGKDSMSGSFEDLDVPPTLVSFAITTAKANRIVSPEFKAAGHRVSILRPTLTADGLPDPASERELLKKVSALLADGQATACYALGWGGIAEAVLKMAFGNGFGFRFREDISADPLFEGASGAFMLELTDGAEAGELLGTVTEDGRISLASEALPLQELYELYEAKPEPVYPTKAAATEASPAFELKTGTARISRFHAAEPKVLIPVFPGTNCEYDSAKVMRDAGAKPVIQVLNNLSADGIARSIDRFATELRDAQMIFIPGGFSGGDEPDGSGKFILAFFRAAAIRAGVAELLEKRDGLMLGICNGFQALIKLGLVPYGKITDAGADSPTLTFNTIGRHQSRIVRTKIVSNSSPWLSFTKPGDVYSVPISHGEGRFLAAPELIRALAENGQVATQYVDLDGNVSDDLLFNPNGSVCAVEGITSPDGRVFGKMGHVERIGTNLYRNVPGEYDMRMFESAVRYFRG